MMTGSDRVFDVAVVGAGPAGLAAATEAAHRGARVAVLDAGVRVGGQYWRQPAEPAQQATMPPGLQHDLTTYDQLARTLEEQQHRGTTQCLLRHHVWALERGQDGTFVVHAIDRRQDVERRSTVVAHRLVLATGAYDRQVPFPGWDLPGVLSAGGAQSLHKGHGVRLSGLRVLVAGTGPFLLSVATGLAAAGAEVVGVHEANPRSAWLRASGTILRNPAKLREGLGYSVALARRRIPVHTRSVVVEARGEGQLRAVTTTRLDADGNAASRQGRETVRADLLATGWGFTPQLELPLALGCETRMDTDESLVCVVDDMQQTSVDRAYVAGELCGIGGAALALAEGEVAGAAAAGGTPSRRVRRRRDALRGFAASMHRAHPVPGTWMDRLQTDTVICRCEDVTLGQLRTAAERFEATEARTAKLLSRAGMGWCQGRVCGYPSACLLASWSGTPVAPRLIAERPVATPVALGTLAGPAHSPAPSAQAAESVARRTSSG
ncbi:MAG: NAD(P)/FAD-dependent oxidoreductase [Actinomycetes bacterium]